MAKILLVEDDLMFSQLLQNFLQKNGHEVIAAQHIKNGLKYIEQHTFDLLLLDYRLPDGTGFEVLAKAREKGLPAPVIIMTSFNDVRTAVTAMRSGAFDYITKPINPDELLMIMGNALGVKPSKTESKRGTEPQFIRGKSQHSDKLHEYIDLVSPTDMSVLIQGESGTGKEYVARMIHQQSKRAAMPFVAIDCGALSKDLAASELFGHVKGAFTGAIADKKGLFEYADGGTLFMDEVGNLSYDVQVKLLRTLQEKIIQPVGTNKQIPVNVRIITATNDDLTGSVSVGDFRGDLYHRINEFKIQLPPLRQRRNDLDVFIKYFIEQANADLDRNITNISAEVKEIFYKYDWPGNLRELKNVIRRMVLLTHGNEANTDALPEEMLFSVANNLSNIPAERESDLKAQNEINEKKLIEKTLREVKHNKSKAAKLLNIDRKTLYSKMERYGLDRD
ncbi:MAG TPA: sigma-54 dependent transcriptional regulator [Mucilaginibacter sp.]|jgi:two-component system response regulator HydG